MSAPSRWVRRPLNGPPGSAFPFSCLRPTNQPFRRIILTPAPSCFGDNVTALASSEWLSRICITGPVSASRSLTVSPQNTSASTLLRRQVVRLQIGRGGRLCTIDPLANIYTTQSSQEQLLNGSSNHQKYRKVANILINLFAFVLPKSNSFVGYVFVCAIRARQGSVNTMICAVCVDMLRNQRDCLTENTEYAELAYSSPGNRRER
jgi:hypothetical protein